MPLVTSQQQLPLLSVQFKRLNCPFDIFAQLWTWESYKQKCGEDEEADEAEEAVERETDIKRDRA